MSVNRKMVRDSRFMSRFALYPDLTLTASIMHTVDHQRLHLTYLYGHQKFHGGDSDRILI
ncbi:hypothetical protein RCH21_002087 [Arthrobacter sp. PL16]|nr:hypothetical protein [Arthrobacter sp. PL16]